MFQTRIWALINNFHVAELGDYMFSNVKVHLTVCIVFWAFSLQNGCSLKCYACLWLSHGCWHILRGWTCCKLHVSEIFSERNKTIWVLCEKYFFLQEFVSSLTISVWMCVFGETGRVCVCVLCKSKPQGKSHAPRSTIPLNPSIWFCSSETQLTSS